MLPSPDSTLARKRTERPDRTAIGAAGNMEEVRIGLYHAIDGKVAGSNQRLPGSGGRCPALDFAKCDTSCVPASKIKRTVREKVGVGINHVYHHGTRPAGQQVDGTFARFPIADIQHTVT